MIRKLFKRLWRSAITGRFVSRKYAEGHPETTVSERVLRDEGDAA
jgi:hypothetical protein